MVRLVTLHPTIVCSIAEGSVKNGISVGGRKAIKLQLVQKRVQVARPQYARIMMPSRDRPKHSAYAVGPKARLHPDSVAVGIPRIESLLRICILLSPHSTRIIAVCYATLQSWIDLSMNANLQNSLAHIILYFLVHRR